MSDTVSPETKLCKHCQQVKPLSEFRKNGRGTPLECKACNSKRNHEKYIQKKLLEGDKPSRDKPSKRVSISPFATEMTCKHCQQTKPLEEFRKDCTKNIGYKRECKFCYWQREAQRKNARPNGQRSQLWSKMHLAGKTRISNEIYDAMFAAQNGLCAACGQPETKKGKHSTVIRRLALDHNHQTGQVRGLLCSDCNLALGFLKDCPERVEGLLIYIRKHTS